MKKILVVEDDLSYKKLLRDQLILNGYESLEARDGNEGLAVAKHEHPDLILLDIRMPDMDGMTMLTELRKDAYGKSAKVIILTNYEPDVRVLGKVIKGQPSFYLVKSDIELSELIEKIKEVLQFDKKVN